MGAGTIVRAAVRGHQGTTEWVNTLYFKQLSAGGDMGGLADAIDTTIYQAVEALQGTQWGLDDITVAELVVGGGAELVSPRTTVGTGAQQTVHTQAAACISFRTGLAGRSHRGRNYLPLGSGGTGTSGVITGSVVTTILDAYNAFLAIYGPSGTDTDYQWVVWSRKLGETLSGSPPHVTAYNYAAGAFPIATVKCDGIFRTQRRREVGVGS